MFFTVSEISHPSTRFGCLRPCDVQISQSSNVIQYAKKVSTSSSNWIIMQPIRYLKFLRISNHSIYFRSALSGLHSYQHSEHVRSKTNGVNHKQNLTGSDNFINRRSASTSILPSKVDMMTNSNGMPNTKSPSQRSVQSLRSVSRYSNHNHLGNHTDPNSSVSLLDRNLVSLLKYVLFELEKLYYYNYSR